jgi:hypothetical protein
MSKSCLIGTVVQITHHALRVEAFQSGQEFRSPLRIAAAAECHDEWLPLGMAEQEASRPQGFIIRMRHDDSDTMNFFDFRFDHFGRITRMAL